MNALADLDWTAILGRYLEIDLGVVLRVAILILVAFPLVAILSRSAGRYARRFGPQRAMIAGKAVFWGGTVTILISVLSDLGFSLTHLLGAAGIVGIAVGFASQTSLSNVISGIFLITEQPFIVGDLITVGDTTGQVLSIDMLSIKLRTFDNRFVRIPNETLIKSAVINVTRFPIRRLDVKVSVAYKEDIPRVRKTLMEIARDNPVALQEPEPLVIFSEFGSSSIDLLFAVWTARADFLTLRNSIHEEIKARFDREGIEIPFPHLSLYTGEVTDPFPVQLVQSPPPGAAEASSAG